MWRRTGEPTALELLDRRAEASGNAPFLTVVDRPLTAGAVASAGFALARFLAARGVVKGDRVATLFENSPEAVTAFFAAIRAGAMVVPINSAYRGRFLDHVLTDSGATVLIVQRDLFERALEVFAGGGARELRHVVVVDPERAGEADRQALAAANVTLWYWDEVVRGNERGDLPVVTAEDPAICFYTGGTTGPSKGCVLSQTALVHHAVIVADACGRTKEDAFFTPLPLFHLNAIKFGVVGTLAIGGTASISRRFSVSGFWHEVEKSSARMASLLGSMATLIARSEHEPLGKSLRLIMAVPMPGETDRLLRERFGLETFSGAYGMTECSTISLQTFGVPNKPGAAGKVNAADYDVRIFGDDDVELPPGEPGEIVARPRFPNIIFKGYWRRPEDTLAAFKDLWFRTGDIGRIDEEGYLYFVDRKNDYLRRRGENISSYEVETVLLEHDAIADVAVHAVKSEIVEDDLKVTAVLKSGATLAPREFFEWMLQRLPYFALPAYIEFRDELPRSPVGRVLKRDLRDEGVTPATWSRETAGVSFERR